MNPSNARRQEADEWLSKAAEDLASARVLIDAGHPSTALFHCQQCAEKSLKAFLTWHDQKGPPGEVAWRAGWSVLMRV